MKRIVWISTVLSVGLAFLAVQPSVRAEPMTVPAVAASEAGVALELPSGVTVSLTGSSAIAGSLAGTGPEPQERYNDFPSAGDTYLVLSTGDAEQVFAGDPNAQLSTDIGGDGQPDTSELVLSIAPTADVGCLFIDFAMGTEERVHTYAESEPSDALSITRETAPGIEYAVNAGRGYFVQANWPAQPKPYTVNAINYWHQPGNPLDPVPGSTEEPRLQQLTALNNLTTRDTARVPLTFEGGVGESVTIRVSDAGNGSVDSVAFVDHVRLGASCDAGSGVEPNPAHDGGIIGGIRGVGNELWYDPIPTTSEIELYDDATPGGNGWRSPSGTPVELRFRWYRASATYALNGDMRNWSAIPDADRQSYVPGAADRSRVLIVMVTGVVDGHRYETFPSTGTSNSWYVTLPIANGTFQEGEDPIISASSGGAVVGEVLTAQIGHTVPREDTYSWQWYADGAAISGATAQTLTLGSGHAGKTITVRATAKRLNFDSKTWISAGYGPIAWQTWQSRGIPTIVDDGSPQNGEVITADHGPDWSPEPNSYSYQWKRNGVPIPGATNATYALKAVDVGADMSVMVSGVLAGFAQDPQESTAIRVLGATMNGGSVTVSGTAQVGQRLTGTVAGWDPSGASFTYAWHAGETLLQTGPSQYLTIPAAARGKQIVLTVTGSRSGYTPLPVASEPTTVVLPGQMVPGTVRMYGTAKVGSTLGVSAGYWSPYGVKVTYQWKIGSRKVKGAKGRQTTLRLPRSARGKRITVTVIGRLAGYKTVQKSVRSGRVKR